MNDEFLTIEPQGTEIKLADCMEVSLDELGKDVSLDVAKGFDETISLETSQGGGGPDRLQVAHEYKHPLQQSAAWGGGIDLEEDVPQGLGAIVRAPDGSAAVSEPNATYHPAPFEDDRFSKLFPNSFKISGIKHVCDNALSSLLNGLPQILTSELLL